MKILIIGYGAVGSVLAKLLLKEKSVKKIYCVDIKFFKKLENKKIIYKLLSVLDKRKFVSYLKEIQPDAVINTSLPKFNLNIMECCLKAKVNYMDTASFWDIDRNPKAKVPYKTEQMKYNKAFAKNKLIGIIGAGVAPGLDNILAAQAASELDEIDYIKIRMVEDTGSKEIFFSWNKDWLLDELNCKPLIYENKKFKLVENFGAEEEYIFPEPIGKRKTHYFAQDEAGTIPLYIKTKNLDVKICDNNIEVSKLLVSLGLTSNKSVNVGKVGVKPVEVLSKVLPDSKPGDEKKFPNSVFAIAVETLGKKSGRKKSIVYSVVFPKQSEISKMNLGANFISYPTALSVKLFIMKIHRINLFGVFPPECLNKEIRKSIISNLPPNHVKVYRKAYTPK